MDNTIIVNSAELKFSQFVDSIQPGIAPEYFGEQWLVKMNKLNEFIKQNGLEEKITLSDDRLVLTAFKTLCKDININATLTEWWIVKRYMEVYVTEKSAINEAIREFVDMHIGYEFSDAQRDEEGNSMYMDLAKSIRYGLESSDSNHLKLPKFVINEISSKFKVAEITHEKSKSEYTEEQIRASWREEFDLAEMMLDSDLTDEEMEVWGEKFDLAEMMLA